MILGNSSTDYSMNWSILAPVVMGFLAVWYLLPAPRPRSRVNGALAVLATLLGFGTFFFHGLGHDLAFNAEGFLFYAFSLQAVAFAILMIAQRNPARAAIFFAIVVLSVCGLFLLLAAPFLMAATIIIYAGAIIVTFLFVIMLSHQTGQTDANDRSREPSLAAAVGFLLLGTLLVVLQRTYSTREIDELIQRADQYARNPVIDDELRDPMRATRFLDDVSRVRKQFGYGHVEIPSHVDGVERSRRDSDAVESLREALSLNPPVFPPMTEDESDQPDLAEVKSSAAQIHYELAYLKAVRDGRIAPDVHEVILSQHGRAWRPDPPDDPEKTAPKRLPNSNIAALGRTLFTDHLLAIELGGTLLLVATIGAIAIAGGRREKTA